MEDQLLDNTTVASLATLLSSVVVTQMHRMPRPKVRVMGTKAMSIMSMVMAMVMVMGMPVVGPMS